MAESVREQSAVDCVFFDLDGTLADSLPGISYAVETALAEADFSASSLELRSLIGPPIRSIFAKLLPQTAEADLDGLERSFRLAYDTEGWRRTAAYEGAVEAIRCLKLSGKTLYLVTNKPKHVTSQILNQLGIQDCFSGVLTRDSREPPFESKGAMLCHLLSLQRIDPARCLMVGDAPEDVEGATHAGMRAAIMLHGYGADRVPAGQPGCRHLEDFKELLAIFLADGEGND